MGYRSDAHSGNWIWRLWLCLPPPLPGKGCSSSADFFFLMRAYCKYFWEAKLCVRRLCSPCSLLLKQRVLVSRKVVWLMHFFGCGCFCLGPEQTFSLRGCVLWPRFSGSCKTSLLWEFSNGIIYPGIFLNLQHASSEFLPPLPPCCAHRGREIVSEVNTAAVVSPVKPASSAAEAQELHQRLWDV